MKPWQVTLLAVLMTAPIVGTSQALALPHVSVDRVGLGDVRSAPSNTDFVPPHARVSASQTPFNDEAVANLAGARSSPQVLAGSRIGALSGARENVSGLVAFLIGAMIPIGLLASTFGIYLFSFTWMTAMCAAGAAATYMFISGSESAAAHEWILPLVVIAAIISGYNGYRLPKLGVFTFGASFGVGLAVLLCTTPMYDRANPSNPRMVLIATAVVFGVMSGLLALVFRRYFIVVAMAYGGSLSSVYGVGFFAGHRPALQAFGEAGTPRSSWLWLGLALFVLQAAAGMYVQFSMLLRSDAYNELKDDANGESTAEGEPRRVSGEEPGDRAGAGDHTVLEMDDDDADDDDEDNGWDSNWSDSEEFPVPVSATPPNVAKNTAISSPTTRRAATLASKRD